MFLLIILILIFYQTSEYKHHPNFFNPIFCQTSEYKHHPDIFDTIILKISAYKHLPEFFKKKGKKSVCLYTDNYSICYNRPKYK